DVHRGALFLPARMPGQERARGAGSKPGTRPAGWPLPYEAAADRKEQTSFAAKRPHPLELRDPVLNRPVVNRRREQVAFVVESRARKGSEKLYAVFVKPPLHLAHRVRVFFRVSVLIAQPRACAGRFGLSLLPNRIERNYSKTGEPRNRASETQRQATERI